MQSIFLLWTSLILLQKLRITKRIDHHRIMFSKYTRKAMENICLYFIIKLIAGIFGETKYEYNFDEIPHDFFFLLDKFVFGKYIEF